MVLNLGNKIIIIIMSYRNEVGKKLRNEIKWKELDFLRGLCLIVVILVRMYGNILVV